MELLDDGSWRFRPHGYGMKAFTLGRGEVEKLEVQESTGVGKLTAASLVIGMVALLALGLLFASWESTP